MPQTGNITEVVKNNVFTTLNKAMTQAFGNEAVQVTDVSGLSSAFNYLNIDDEGARKKLFFNALLSRFAKEFYNTRMKKRKVLPIWRDSIDYGSMVLKTYVKPTQAESNKAYEIKDGQEVNLFTIKLPEIKSAIVNDQITWEMNVTILDKQINAGFTSESALKAFFNHILVQFTNSMEQSMQEMEKAILNKFIAIKIKKNNAVFKLLTMYKEETSVVLTPTQALKDKDFLKFYAMTLSKHLDLMEEFSSIYNVEKFERFTPKEANTLCVLADVSRASSFYLESDTYHKELVTLPRYHSISSWQGLGTAESAGTFSELSKINVIYDYELNPDTGLEEAVTLEKSNIIAVMFDEYAIACNSVHNKSISQYSETYEVTHKTERVAVQNYVDPSENGAIFILE